jgi:polyhydroxybutyrate depolymerase
MNRWGGLMRYMAAILIALFLAACGDQAQTVPIHVGDPAPTTTGTSSTSPTTPAPVVPGKSSNGRTLLIPVGDELQRMYRVHIPLTAPEGPRPLVVVLHGGGSRPQTVQYSVGLDNVADRLGLYIAYPEAVGGYWNDGQAENVRKSGGVDDVAFIMAVIQDMRARQPIDLKRVFVVGHGEGGIMAACFAAAKPNAVAGIGLVSSQLIYDSRCLPRKKPISVLMVHGTKDPVFPWKGSLDKNLRTVKSTADYFLSINRLSGTGSKSAMADRDPHDGTRVAKTVWGEPKRYMLALYVVTNGGHPWPGSDTSSRNLATSGRTSRDLDTSAIIGHFALDVRAPGR